MMYRNSLFFRLVNFRLKNIRVKKFSDRPNWWALIEEIEPRAEEMACEKKMACVYTRICGKQQLGKYFCVAES